MGEDFIYHVSENKGIQVFEPRPAPSYFKKIKGNVVFGISEKLLHNYLLPRECPRVCYYARPESSLSDSERFLRNGYTFVIAVEKKWLPLIQQTTIYVYEFNGLPFSLLDECAGYYISYVRVEPISVRRIDNPLNELVTRSNVELRVLLSLESLANEIRQSSLNFSLIRMKNAMPENSIPQWNAFL